MNSENKCKNCGKEKGDHKSSTMNCPIGRKGKTSGYTSFHETDTFEVKEKKKIKTSSAKAKGRNLQNYVAEKISILTNTPLEKDGEIVGREMGQAGTDVRLSKRILTLFPYSVECKSGNSFSFPKAVEQARKNILPNTNWLLVTKRDRDKPIVSIDAEVFFELLEKLNKKDID